MTSNPPAQSARSSAADPLSWRARWTRPHRVFLVFGLVFGLCLCFLTAPFQVPDEPAHFYRAYQISEGRLLPLYRDKHGGADLPSSLAAVAGRFEHVHANPRIKPPPPPVRVSWAEIRDALHVPLDPAQRQFTPTVAAIYSPASYVPQATAIFLGRQFELGPLALMYLARIGNLFFWMALSYLALRVAPTCHRPLLLLLLMPMTLFEAASVSADPTTIAIAVLFTALALRYVKIDGRDAGKSRVAPVRIGPAICFAFMALTAMLALTKFVYLPLLALVFLIPPARLGGVKRYVLAVGILGLLGLAAFLAWNLPTFGAVTVVMDQPDINPAEQLRLLRAHPSHVVTLIFSTLWNKGWPISRSFIGRLGWLDTPMNHLFTDGYVLALIAACWLADGRPSFPRRWLAPIILIPVALSAFAITLLNYLYDNPVGKPFADGVQGRYLIPLAPAMIVLLWGLAPRWPGPLSRKTSGKLNLATTAVVGFSCVYTLAVVTLRYYIHR
jgi:uncharacterized membrane protein